MGLAISKRLVELMGGAIGVNSILGQGSTFFIEISFDLLTRSKPVYQEETTNDLKGLRVLLVSNSKNYEITCSSYLRHWNAEVIITNDIGNCLELAEEMKKDSEQIDIIVIPHIEDHSKVVNVRKTFIANGHMPYPRFVIGEDPRDKSDILLELEEVTMVNINPLQRASFVTAVAIAAGRASPEVTHEQPIFEIKGGRAPTPQEALEQGKLILFAEDNLTNQDVIRRQLTRLGYACELANDGKEAYEMWCEKPYAILLTDCHMPEWDGFELTAAIRRDEESADKRSPIIAITANALQGEAERCIAGGMDDYMSKPVEMKTLQTILHKWMGDGGITRTKEEQGTKTQPVQSGIENSPGISNGAIDERALKDLVGDDQETFKEILSDFIEPSRAIIKEIYLGFENRSAQEVKQSSHKLKSAAFSIGANALGELCKELEAAAMESNWETIDNAVPNIDGLMKLVEDYISQL